MRIDEIGDRRDKVRLRQRLDHQRALPQMIFGKRPVLHRAAAAGAEMLADRHRALVARSVDMHQMPPVRMTGHGVDRHHLARQRIRHKCGPNRRVGDAVAAMPQAVDGQLFGHVPA